MLKYLSNKIFVCLSLCCIFGASLEAANCNTRVFSVKVADNISISEILNQLGNTCDFSVIVKPSDEEANETLTRPVTGISIKDLSLRQIFEILLSQNDLIYTYKQNILTVSSIDTRSFKIDYITSVREGKATTSANAEATPVQTGNSGSGTNSGGTTGGTNNTGSQDNLIETTEKFDFWENIATEIEAVMNTGRERFKSPAPIVNSNAGLVSVTGTKSQLERVARYIRTLNRSLKKQVSIDVRIVAVDLNNQFSKGIDWSRFSLGFTNLINSTDSVVGSSSGINPLGGNFGFWHLGKDSTTTNNNSKGIKSGLVLNGAINLSLDGVINFLETTGSTRVVSSPKITTMNNQQALISVGDNINYILEESTTYGAGDQTNATQTQYTLFVGILLNILPQISDDGKIMLRINPSLSNFKYADDNQRSTTPKRIAPDTLQKKISSVVQVNSGDTIVLGGLISQESGNFVNKVPILGDIPLFGYLFKNDTKQVRNTELVFIITPRVIDLDAPNDVQTSLKELGFSDGIF